MELSQYDYAKDKRDDKKYRSDFDRGIYNQKVAIQQLIWDRMMSNPDKSYSFIANPDKTFQTDQGYWVYNPDYIVSVNGKEIPCEVKVQMTPLDSDIDLKKSQIDRLIELGGTVLYATKQKFSLMYAIRLAEIGELKPSERFGGKKVYNVPISKMTWEFWIHSPEFKAY